MVIKSLVKITLITGWQLPTDNDTRAILYSEFSRLLVEQYKTINENEIDYAMRKYGIRIKDWGKNINLSLIAEPLDLYLAERLEVSKEEQTKKQLPIKNQNMQQVSNGECDWTETWEALVNGESAIIPVPVYDWAVKKGFINLTIEEKKELVIKAQNKLSFDAGTLSLPEEQVKELRKRYKNTEDVLVLNEAKKIAVRDALNKILKS